ncbi:MAG TPA: c-type cytochrome, partial [Kofleriaceae bacterium]|nr:c-type cytochrome [Kofleriaceae bacterium]
MRSFVLLVLPAIWAACSSGSATPAPKPQESPPAKPPTPPPAPAAPAGPDLAAAQASYTRLCAPCHADDGTGYRADNAPSLVSPTFLESATDEFLQRSIVWGRPGTSMGAYGKALGGPLDDAAVTGLVAWLRAKGPQPRALAAAGQGVA